MPAVRRGPLLEFLWRAHRWIYRRSGGRFGATLAGRPVILLTTTGRRTGNAHAVALHAWVDGDRYVVVASNAGGPRHPVWFLNLQTHPDARLQHGRRRQRVRARLANGAERQRLWDAVVHTDGAYAEYQSRTHRQIPVVILERADAEGPR